MSMKFLVALVQPPKYQAVLLALRKIGLTRLTVCDAVGQGRQRGQTPTYRGNEYEAELLRKTYLEMGLVESDVNRSVETIVESARTGAEGTIGDGKVFVLPLEDAIDIGSGRRGPEAL